MTKFHRDPDEDSGPVTGSGSFLADMGEDAPDLLRLKYLMANEIAVAVSDRGVTQIEVARMTGLAQPDVSRIVNGRVKDYSIERLLGVMTALGKNVHVAWSNAQGPRGVVGVGVPESFLNALREAQPVEDAVAEHEGGPSYAMSGP